MRKNSNVVMCEEHGEQQKAFVCMHLLESMYDQKKVGFHCADDPDDSRSDAWCNACERIRKDGGGDWTDETSEMTGIKLLCGVCYDRVRELNEIKHKFWMPWRPKNRH